MRMKSKRSLLFVPATTPRFLQKAAQRGADAIIIDLEDSVVPERKQEARESVIEAAAQLHDQGAVVALRVNAGEEHWKRDLAYVDPSHISMIVLPKVDAPEQVRALAQALDCLGSETRESNPMLIAALLESPRAVLNAAAIACSSERLSSLGFGAEDYCTLMGIEPDPQVLSWPAQQVAIAAHAHGLECWGLAASVSEIANLKAYEREAMRARNLGFTGSVAIHPAQVPILNRCFSPSREQIEWARRVVDAHDQCRAKGDGAAQLDGKMIDLPIIERARQYLDLGDTYSS
ncbi:HpcH/HpaI aldolase/citrate lyase family protein [Paralcaligenes ginsengisoli]